MTMRLYALADIAAVLSVSKQRVHELFMQGRLPSPLDTTSAGRIWKAEDIDNWLATWDRKPGRPAKRQA